MKSFCKSLASAFATILLAVASSTLGQTVPATQPAPANIAKLINQLGSDSNSDRDAAQRQLITLGEQSISELKRAAESSEDPEIRSRSAAILQSLKDRQINQPALITLHANQMSAQDALNAIGTQAHVQMTAMGMAVSRSAKPGKTVTMDVDQKPFWEVMTDVCKQLNICPNLDYNGLNSMRLSPAWENWMAQPSHEIVGRTWISVESLTHVRTVDLNDNAPARDKFTGRLIVFPEPGLHVTHMSDFTVEEAADDAGHSLMPRALPLQFSSSGNSHPLHQLNHQLEFSLMYPDQQPGSKISILKGSLTMVVAEDPLQYRVDDVLGTPVVTNPLKNAAIVTRFTTQGSNYSVEIQCTRGSLDQEQWDAMVNCMDDLSLLDAGGHPLIAVSPIRIHSMSTMAGLENFKASGLFSPLSSAKASEPRCFQWNIPPSLKSEHLAVTFKDLPMP
jgi:hypothetical protein